MISWKTPLSAPQKFRRRLPLLAVALALCSCAPASPPQVLGQPIRKPLSVALHVSVEAGRTDELGGIAGIVDAVTAGLDERGVRYQLFTSDDDQPPSPRVEIWVARWDPGDRGKRAALPWALGAGGAVLKSWQLLVASATVELALTGDFCVVARVFQDGESNPTAVLQYAGSVHGTDERASVRLGNNVGNGILSDVFRAHNTPTFGQCLSQSCG